MTSLENTSTHLCINCSTSFPLHPITIHGCRTTHCQEKTRNPGGQFLFRANSTDHCELQLEKSSIKQKAQVCPQDPQTHVSYAVKRRLASLYIKYASRLTPPELVILVLATFLTSFPIPRPNKFWALFISFSVSHQAGYIQLQEEQKPRSQQLAVLFLFPCSGQGITRQHPPVPGYHGNTEVALFTVPL